MPTLAGGELEGRCDFPSGNYSELFPDRNIRKKAWAFGARKELTAWGFVIIRAG